MGKFSKNGKPLGRVSEGANKNKAWTEEEDKYLALSISEGKTLNEVASRLGRTRMGISFRKYTLGLEGRFAIKRGEKTKTTKTPKEVKEIEAPKDLRLLTLESGIPIPSRGGSRMHEKERIQIREILNQMKVGQSFAVPRNLVHVAKHIATKEFESYRLKTSATSADKKFFRIFRVA